MTLTPNPLPAGQSCGTCRFAGTHTYAASDKHKTLVRCLRYPPQRRGKAIEPAMLDAAIRDTIWPVLTWDDWCGEWMPRWAAVAEKQRFDTEAAVNRYLRHSARDAGIQYARESVADVVAELAPGWDFVDATPLGQDVPVVALSSYDPDRRKDDR